MIKNESERLVFGEVYVPMRLDSDNEFMRAEEIVKAAHRFMLQNQNDNIDQEHHFEQSDKGDVIVQSYIAKANDPDGFHEGAWVAGGYIRDDERWSLIQKGELNGWSMAGRAQKTKCKVNITALTSLKSETSDNEGHTHVFKIGFDKEGKVIQTQTEVAAGHYHYITKTTATDEANGHAHRFDVNWEDGDMGITKEERTIEAKELTEVFPKWLSLVRHAAVRRGFKIVKNDIAEQPVEVVSQEVKKMDRVIHAIIADKDYDLSVLLNKEDLIWDEDSEIVVKKVVSVAKGEKSIILDKEEFEEDSFKVMRLDDVDIVAGILKSDNTSGVLKAPRKLKKEEMSMTRAEIEGLVEEKIRSVVSDELVSLKNDIGAILKVQKEEAPVEPEVAEKPKESKKPKEEVKVEEVIEAKEDAKVEKEEAIPEWKAELAAIRETLVKLTEGQKEVVEKTDAIAKKTTSYPGSLDEERVEVEKSDGSDGSFWAGRLFARNNPRINSLLKG